jgi:hypothetical protein
VAGSLGLNRSRSRPGFTVLLQLCCILRSGGLI